MKFFGYYFDDHGLLHYEPDNVSPELATAPERVDRSDAIENSIEAANDNGAAHDFRHWLDNWFAVSPEDRMHTDYLAHIRRLSDPDMRETSVQAEPAVTLS